MSDGSQDLPWKSAPASIAAIDAFLTEQGVAPHEPVALECACTAPGALTLLALLLRGTTVVLLPPAGTNSPVLPLPKFLTKLVRVPPPGSGAGELRVTHPQTFVDLQSIAAEAPLAADSPLRRERLILRTSGSLAEPKWVVHTHAGVLENARNAVGRLDLRRADRVLIPVPLAHMYGLGAAFLPALISGASVCLLEGANLIRYLERERTFLPTVAFLTPSLCGMLLRPRSTPAHYRHIVVAGDRLDPAAFQQAQGIYRRVVNLYGSTEMGVICATDAQAPAASDAVTVGQPLPGVRLRTEPRQGADCAEGSGDLLCAHPFGFTGYVSLDGAPVPEERANDEGFYPTRDVARLHPDGTVEVLGRSDHATKRDGRLVMLAQVERALAQLPGVTGAAVVLAQPTMRGRAMIAFVTAQEGAAVDIAQLRRASAAVLPPYAVPDEIRLLPAFPLLPSGKLDRRSLERAILMPSPLDASRAHGPRAS